MFRLRSALGIAVFFLMSSGAFAQQETSPVVEVFTGYSISRQRGSDFLTGWNGQFAANIKRSFGIVADVSEHTLNEDFESFGPIVLSEARLRSLTLGLRAYNRDFERLTPFVHALFGVSRLAGKAPVSPGNFDVTEKQSFDPLTVILGGGLDVKAGGILHIRVVQLDYRYLRFDEGDSNGYRLGFGLNFAF